MTIEPILSAVRNMNKSLALVVGLAVAVNLSPAAGIHVQPPENTWARLNKSTTLKCKSSDPIQTCTWMTPTGSIHTLNRGQQAEEGRLKYNSDGEEDECGILIDAVEEKDVGAWTCVLGISLDETEVKSVSGKANVKLATRPSAVRLSTPFESAPFKEVKQDVACVVNNAQPKPVFTWYVGDELVDYPVTDSETDEGGVKSWVQTMEYSPRKSHANQTLRCVVEHVGLDDVDTKEAVVVLSFTEDFAEAAEVANAEAETEEDYMGAAPYYAVAVVVSLVGVGAVGFFLYVRSRKVNMKTADNAEDVEAPVVEGEEKAAVVDDNESESKDEEKEEEEKKTEDEDESKPSMSCMEGLIGRCLKNKEAVEEKMEEQKEEEEEKKTEDEDKSKPSTSCMEGLMGRCLKNQEAAKENMEEQKEGEDDAEENKEETDDKEKQAEENGVPVEDKTPKEEEEKEEKVEVKKKTNPISKIMKHLKKSDRASKKEGEEEGEKTAEEETGEEKKDEEKVSRDVEYEPEEKEEMNKKQEAGSAEEKKKEEEEKK